MADSCQRGTSTSSGSSSSVLRIYWPTDVLEIERRDHLYEPSVVIGWRNGNEDLVVVTTLPFLDPSIVDNLLGKEVLLSEYPLPAPQIYSICGVKRLSVLGTMNYKEAGSSTNSNANEKGGSSGSNRMQTTFIPSFPKYTPHSSFFNAVLDPTMKYPEIKHDANNSHPLHCLSFFKQFPFTQIQMIMFEPPLANRMQYYSLHPIPLELSEKSSLTIINQEFEKPLLDAQTEKEEMAEKIKQHACYNQAENDRRGVVLHNTINQINCCHELGIAMRKKAAIIFPKIRTRTLRRRLSVSEFAIESAKQVQNSVLELASTAWKRLVPMVGIAFIGLIICLRVVAEGVLRVLEWRPKASFYALKDVSATALQIDLRLQQFCYWPVQYLKIKRRSRDWSSNTSFNMEYIRFYNNIWLVFNDVIIGITLSKMILERKQLIIDFLCHVIDHTLTVDFENTILWLMDWPGGLKLNTELAAFFGELVLWVIQFWGMVLNLFRPYFGIMVTIVAYAGFAGATLLISIVSDLVSIFPVHVYAFYLASGKIYHWQLTVLRSLFHLFRGKKRNILRNRVDSCNYELDQLLMGTILFISLIFLLPTVLVFYLTFAGCRLAIILVNAGLESCLACLNHFPLFAILLRIKDFKRVPGGIMFDVVQNPARNHTSTSSTSTTTTTGTTSTAFVFLKPKPLPLSKMFYQFSLLSLRIRIHYLSFPVIVRLISGQFVPIQRSKLYTLLYSTLPARRISIQQLHKDLYSEAASASTSGAGPIGVGFGVGTTRRDRNRLQPPGLASFASSPWTQQPSSSSSVSPSSSSSPSFSASAATSASSTASPTSLSAASSSTVASGTSVPSSAGDGRGDQFIAPVFKTQAGLASGLAMNGGSQQQHNNQHHHKTARRRFA